MTTTTAIDPDHVRKLVDGMPASDVLAKLREQYPNTSFEELEAAINGALAEKAAEAESRRAHADGRNGKPTRRIASIAAADIEPKPVSWLWNGRIPAGMLSVLAGEEGLGKSQVALALAAKLTRGELDGELKGTPASVLVAATEDSRKYVIVPRLIAAGADLRRVHFVTVETGDQAGSVRLPDDAALLGEHAAELGVAMVIIDPLSEFLAKGTDSHKDSDVRAALGPLADAAQTHSFAVLSIMHINKGSSTRTRKALMGSVAFRSAARSVLIFGLDPDSSDGEKGPDRVLALDKHNLGPWVRSYQVKIEPHEFENTQGQLIKTARASLGDKCGHSAEEVLAASSGSDQAPAPKVAEAKTFLASKLPAPAKEVQAAAEIAGIAPRTLKRAKSELEVRSEKDGQGPWVWTLPEHGGLEL